jgi:hypothetical protein
MEKNADGKLAITRVELCPKITWSGNRRPSAEELDKMHHAAHENCFIASSVKTNVTVAEPTPMAHFFAGLFADRNVFGDVDTIITQVPGLSPARARGARLLDPIRGIFA